MAVITNKTEFIQYCLRQLGAPDIDIEVDDDQLDDAYDDSIRMLQDYHMNGIERQYLKHQLTQQDIDNGYIPLPDSIIGVSKVFNINSSTIGGNYIFDINYQIRLNDLWDLNSSSVAYYSAIRQYTNMLDQMFNGSVLYRFNRVQNRLHLDMTKSKLVIGAWVGLEVNRALTPEEFPELWMEPWFKKYTVAKIKKIWGAKLKKFNNITTIGGVVIDGQNIYNEAVQEIADLEVELRDTYEEPINFLVG